ncbi:cytochrome b/b6 domain-containing protein [Photobacterium sp. SDRW27]|uniref:cytochrome b/b6 domain-containing protein n=1 Tax=Photobacterium obscurum TaxID=2829490 RepID=UPI0022441795|nr:cytochrome b/b6 domain-containing protein [Photobacterium obscurum]MCW8327665.1 cytochrome b/b6 domain-containing protein [Photobacterium obscurum]
MKKTTVIFKRFERFWHWGQAILVLLLLLTGLEIHGIMTLFGFELSTTLHHWAGFIWIAVVILIFTWVFTTGEWKQFVPDMKGIDGVIRFYLYGVFVGEDHPHRMSLENKFNPLQRLAYLGLLFGLLPVQIITGLIFFFFPELRAAGYIDQIGAVAVIHTFSAYAILAFLIVHLYLITLGAKLSSHIKTMLTGKETVDE